MKQGIVSFHEFVDGLAQVVDGLLVSGGDCIQIRTVRAPQAPTTASRSPLTKLSSMEVWTV